MAGDALVTGRRRRERMAPVLAALALLLPLALLACAPAPPIPGVGETWRAQLAGHSQVIVASGDSLSATLTTVTSYDLTSKGWRQNGTWRAWNGRNGWAYAPASGSGRSPMGIFTLTAAGGYAPNPGTRLPYEYRPAYYALIVNGIRTFNRVVAVDTNHVPYSYPSDRRRPTGPAAINGVWLHDTHNSPTAGCVALPDSAMIRIQLWLNPAAHPVILMGPAAQLLR